jgi:hypothetical protein
MLSRLDQQFVLKTLLFEKVAAIICPGLANRKGSEVPKALYLRVLGNGHLYTYGDLYRAVQVIYFNQTD